MDEREFAAVIGETKDVVLSAIERHLAPRFSAAIDDVVQEAYLRAYRSLTAGRFRGDSAVGTWLYAIARNEALRMNERLAREERKLLRSMERDAANDDMRDDGAGSEIDALYDAIARLPEKYRAVLERVARGWPVRDIARELGIETGTVKSRASRGREMLHRLMREDAYGRE